MTFISSTTHYIKLFRDAQDAAVFLGRPLTPNYARDAQRWIDRDVAANLAGDSRRVGYQNALALTDNGAPALRPVSDLAGLSLEPAAFYRDFGIVEVPYFEPLQMPKADVVVRPNFGYGATNADLEEWARRPKVPFPGRVLASGEAQRLTPFGVQVVNIALFRQMYPEPAPAGDGAKLDRILTICEELLRRSA